MLVGLGRGIQRLMVGFVSAAFKLFIYRIFLHALNCLIAGTMKLKLQPSPTFPHFLFHLLKDNSSADVECLKSTPTTMFCRMDWSPDGTYLVLPCATNNEGPTAQLVRRKVHSYSCSLHRIYLVR